MIVLESKYRRVAAELDAVRLELRVLHSEHRALLEQWNTLVTQINRMGGQAFLDRGGRSRHEKPQFTPDELKRLLHLCHPDKHHGSKIAQDITSKLLAMRER